MRPGVRSSLLIYGTFRPLCCGDRSGTTVPGQCKDGHRITSTPVVTQHKVIKVAVSRRPALLSHFDLLHSAFAVSRDSDNYAQRNGGPRLSPSPMSLNIK